MSLHCRGLCAVALVAVAVSLVVQIRGVSVESSDPVDRDSWRALPATGVTLAATVAVVDARGGPEAIANRPDDAAAGLACVPTSERVPGIDVPSARTDRTLQAYPSRASPV